MLCEEWIEQEKWGEKKEKEQFFKKLNMQQSRCHKAKPND